MQTIATVAQLRQTLAGLGAPSRSVGLVPTMGFLHDGHMALVRSSVARCDVTVVSIFVNPAQFGRNEDLTSYPRDFARDLALCEAAGVDVVFSPGGTEVYPPGFQTWVEPGPLADGLCGAFRPGHFRGVATVVTKLFNMVRPDAAFFGEKDFQQAAVIRQLVRDLDMPVAVETVATVREADGMAMSSRNAYLAPGERLRARGISRALFAARAAFIQGERDSTALVGLARATLGGDVDEVQYLELVDARTLEPVKGRIDRQAALCVAAHIGRTRLIDNVVLDPALGRDIPSAA